MRRTRYMTWVFLVLSLAFFTIRDFRFALEAPLASLWTERMFSQERLLGSGPIYTPWLARLYTLDRYVSPAKLVALAEEAARRGDSEFVAFAALNLGPKKDALRLADRAVDANPDLTWIYYFIVLEAMAPFEWQGRSEITREDAARRIERLGTFDPNNAAPHILRAWLIRDRRGQGWPSGSGAAPNYLDALAREAAWCQEMDKAFHSRRYNSYEIRSFTLVRRVLRARGWDHPVVVETTMGLGHIPNILSVRDYTNLLVLKYGAEAEATGKLNEALDNYFLAAEFGDRLRYEDNSLIAQLIGIAVQRITYPRLSSALRKAGQEKEAQLFENVERQVLVHARALRNPLRATTYRFWLVLLANFAVGLVAVFLLASLISVGYVNAKLWVRREKKGRLYHTLTIAENYAPLLLFLSCLALYLSDVPFRRHFENYMTVQEDLSDPYVHASIYPAWGLSNELNSSLEVPNAFQDYVPVALAGVVLLTGVLALGIWRQRRKESLPETAAFEREWQTQNYGILLVVALTVGLFVIFEPHWETSLTVGLGITLLLAAVLWISMSFARRARHGALGSRAAMVTEAGAYLLLLVLAGIAGLGVGLPVSDLVTRRFMLGAESEWTFLALGLISSVTGALSASRMRWRRATPAVFGMLVVSFVGLSIFAEWRPSKKGPAAKTPAAVQTAPAVAPPLTEPEVLVPIAEGKSPEPLAQAAGVRGVAFHEGVLGLWVLREAGAGDDLIKALRGAKWAEDRSLEKQANQIADAEKALRADTKQDPKNPVLHFALGLVLGWQEKQGVAAIAEHRTAIRLRPDFAGAHRALGRGLVENAMNRAAAAWRGPTDPTAGIGPMERTDFAAALAEYQLAARLDPHDALVHRDLAQAPRPFPPYWDPDRAIREYRAELHLEPDDSRARLGLALSLKKKGEFGEAVGEFREVLWSAPEQLREPSLRFEFAEALRKNGDLEEAMPEYREVVRLDPSSAVDHDGLGEALAEQDELTAAIREFHEAIRLDPNSTDPPNDLGLALQRTGNLDGAIAEFRQAIRLDAKRADAHANLAHALDKKGDLNGALEQYRFAIQLQPEDAEIKADYERLSRQLSQQH